MELICPQCHVSAAYVRGEFAGEWVVCHHCEVPFNWRLIRKPARAPRPLSVDRRMPVEEKGR